MKKRSLADALAAWKAEAEAGEAEKGEDARPSSSDDEDYMSDSLLQQLEQGDAPRQTTYAEKRAQTLKEHEERQRREMEEANERRAKRQRGPLAGEQEARELGMAVNVIDRVAAAEDDDEAPKAGSGSSAALRMMLAMGYQPGTALGGDTEHRAPITPDQRWLSKANDAGPKRLGIGHADLSRRIAQAAADVRDVPADPESQADAFRRGKMQDAAQKHTEWLLRKARQILRELDEEAGVEYSPLWLDPSSLPVGHAYYQKSFLRENERGTEDALTLLEFALLEGGEGEGEDQGHGDEHKDPEQGGAPQQEQAQEQNAGQDQEAHDDHDAYAGHGQSGGLGFAKAKAGRPAGIGFQRGADTDVSAGLGMANAGAEAPFGLDSPTEARASAGLGLANADTDAPVGLGFQKASKTLGLDAEQASSPDPRTSLPPPASRRLDAERFCSLPASLRFDLTHTQLRGVYAYCVHCGHRYATYDELVQECPGESEDAHG